MPDISVHEFKALCTEIIETHNKLELHAAIPKPAPGAASAAPPRPIGSSAAALAAMRAAALSPVSLWDPSTPLGAAHAAILASPEGQQMVDAQRKRGALWQVHCGGAAGTFPPDGQPLTSPTWPPELSALKMPIIKSQAARSTFPGCVSRRLPRGQRASSVADARASQLPRRSQRADDSDDADADAAAGGGAGGGAGAGAGAGGADADDAHAHVRCALAASPARSAR